MALLPSLSQSIIAIDIGFRRRIQGQSLRRIDLWMVGLLPVNQPVQEVQDMRLGGHACVQRQFYGTQNGVFIMVQNQRQDIDHLAVSAFLAQHVVLQAAEGFGHLDERRAIAQGPGFALDDSKIVAPIIDDPAWLVVRPLNDAIMGANGLTFRHNNQPFGIDMQADAAIGKTGRDAVAIALEGDQACR